MKNIIFWGTPKFSDQILQGLLATKWPIAYVVTQPDRPQGRRSDPVPSSVKLTAQKHNIPVLQPEKLRNAQFIDELREINPELMIVAAYGKIIPKTILDIPKWGTINVHPSLLPKYRGATPVVSAILNGDSKTGISIMLLDEEMDHGPILAQESFAIDADDDNETLHAKSAPVAVRLLLKAIPDYISGKLKPVEQNHTQATYTKILIKEDGRIKWFATARQIDQQIRAYTPWPLSWTTVKHAADSKLVGKKLIIAAANASNIESFGQPGQVKIYNKKIFVQTGDTPVEVERLQLEGRKEMAAKDFCVGYSAFDGAIVE